MVETWKVFSSIKSFSVGSIKKSKYTFEGIIKIKFLKSHQSNNLILAQQKFEISKHFSLFLNGTSKKKSESFPWRLININESFILPNTCLNLLDMIPITNFMYNSIDKFAMFLSPINEHNIDGKNQKTNLNATFSATVLNKPFQISTTNTYNYNFLKGCETICKNGKKTNCMSLFNKNFFFCGTSVGHMSYYFKNYSKNIKELESKQTKQLFAKQWEEAEPKFTEKQLTRKEKLKVAIKDYGVTVIVFHVVISLISLGVCYLIVISGFDYSQSIEVEENAATVETAAKFVVAYAIHKALAPARIGITLVVAPLIVKKLRKIGILKPSKS